MDFVWFVLFLVGIFALVALVIHFLMPANVPLAKKLIEQHGKISNTILGQPAGEVQLPLPILCFPLFGKKGEYITDVFTTDVGGQEIFSFLLHGKTFDTHQSWTNLIPGMGAVGQTSRHCILGQLQAPCPDVEIAKRHAPGDRPAYFSKPSFTSGQEELDKHYAFGGDEIFCSFLSAQVLQWLAKYPFQVMIESGWMLLIDRRPVNIPAAEPEWRTYMQDVSAWTALRDALQEKK